MTTPASTIASKPSITALIATVGLIGGGLGLLWHTASQSDTPTKNEIEAANKRQKQDNGFFFSFALLVMGGFFGSRL